MTDQNLKCIIIQYYCYASNGQINCTRILLVAIK
jgi:hypothetical protein